MPRLSLRPRPSESRGDRKTLAAETRNAGSTTVPAICSIDIVRNCPTVRRSCLGGLDGPDRSVLANPRPARSPLLHAARRCPRATSPGPCRRRMTRISVPACRRRRQAPDRPHAKFCDLDRKNPLFTSTASILQHRRPPPRRDLCGRRQTLTAIAWAQIRSGLAPLAPPAMPA